MNSALNEVVVCDYSKNFANHLNHELNVPDMDKALLYKIFLDVKHQREILNKIVPTNKHLRYLGEGRGCFDTNIDSCDTIKDLKRYIKGTIVMLRKIEEKLEKYFKNGGVHNE